MRALDSQGREHRRSAFRLRRGADTAKASFELPVELRNDIAELAIADEPARRRVVAGRRALAAPARRDRFRRLAPTSPSRCSLRPITSSARWSRSPKCASRQTGAADPARRPARREALGARARRHERRARARCTTRSSTSSKPGGVLIRFAGTRTRRRRRRSDPDRACVAAAGRSAARCRGRRPSTSRRSRRRARSSASSRPTRSR